MDSNVIECELAERDTGLCGCQGGPTLAVLKDVQRAYEEQMEVVDKMPASKKLQTQVNVLRSWVGDLVGQNSLLARAVEELEAEATTQLIRERRKHSEMVMELRAELSAMRRRLARKDSDLRGLLEVLRRLREFDNCTLNGIHFFELTESDIFGSFEIEIRKLNRDVQQYEQTILSLRNEISMAKYQTPDVSKKDAVCCTLAECGDWEPVKDFNSELREEMLSYQERIQKMEANLKKSGNNVRSLRSSNVALQEELHSLRSVCAALAAQCKSHALRDQFKEDIIREMRRQLKQAKEQSKEVAVLLSNSSSVKSRDSREMSPARARRCVRAQPRRDPDAQPPAPAPRLSRDDDAPLALSDDCRSPRLVLSRDDLLSIMPD